MKPNQNLLIASLVLIFIVTACATTSGLKNESLVAGNPRSYDAEFDRVLNAARSAVMLADLSIESDQKIDDNRWMIIGTTGMSLFSYGEIVRVVVEKTSEVTTLVRIITKRRLATNITARGDYSSEIFNYIAMKLKQ